MKANRIVLFLLSNCLVGSLFAQTQLGYVKTLGRPDKQGEALSGVTIRVKGGHNAVLSQDDGTFSMLMTGKRNGDAYSLQQVQKTGYELNEKGVIGRQYAFSNKVPLTIVMVSTAQLQADKQRIEDNAYVVAERNYKARLTQLEQQLNSNDITIEKYQENLHNLQENFEKYQLLIDGLAEHYAHTDYDGLDEKDREINICIENGDLDRADSLIRTLFDPIGVLTRNKEALSRIDLDVVQAQEIIEQANADMAAILRQQEKDAEYLYQLYTIALAHYDNEKARQYIETRALLDTTNVEWQNEAGLFYMDYLADYQKALEIFKSALLVSTDVYGDKSEWGAVFFANIGEVYHHQGNLYDALDCYNTAIEILQLLLGDNHPTTGKMYAKTALVGISMGLHRNYTFPMEYLQKALSIVETAYGETNMDVARIYEGMSEICTDKEEYDNAEEFLMKAWNIRKAISDKIDVDDADTYFSLGCLYFCRDNFKEALKYCDLSLELYINFYGKNHPAVANVYSQVAQFYYNQSDYDHALAYMENALIIRKNCYSGNTIDMARCYRNIGYVYYAKSRDCDDEQEELAFRTKALEAFKNALSVYKTINAPGLDSEIWEIEMEIETMEED